MFCLKCGSQIPDESKFCMKCGTEIPSQVSETTPAAPVVNFYKKLNIGHGYIIIVTQDTFEYKYLLSKKIPIQNITAFYFRKGSILDDGSITLIVGKEKHIIPLRKKYNDDIAEIQNFLVSVNPAITTNSANLDNIARCPKCNSISLSANKKGFGVGKAVIGSALVGPIGLVAGNAGKDKVLVTCLNCGHQFKPRK